MDLNRSIKIVTLGDSNVGKSALLLRFVKKTFYENNPMTLVDILQTQMNIENKTVDLFLWDTGGQERFKSLVSNYFRLADGALLVYDVTKTRTFTELPGWLSLLRAVNDKAVVVIVGNKTDQVDLKDVSITAVKEFAAWHKLDFVETSAKTGENVEQLFQLLAKKILRSISSTSSNEGSEDIEVAKDFAHSPNFQQDDTQEKVLQSKSVQEVPDGKKKQCC
ncbi:Ras-related protein Rab11A [Araneus ventricosus]|uniref:Ras-related protein Rab11A n=1 Tax=Araneus ventricosus TaxID=182803 RepID=A0A4Y2EDE3_ARAVE|nr:Ras-related protein Rab11A [Araneus ventricosus]